MISEKDYQECLIYIKSYWKKATFYLPHERGIHIGLPHKFVAPNGALFANDQFYWDSYFTILGLLSSGKINLAKGMVDNLVFLYKKFKIIPMRNRLYNLGISQPPFLTSMILEVFWQTSDQQWLEICMKTAEEELKKYWQDPNKVFFGLSRYLDHFWTHTTAEHESGWDMTSRFNEQCLDYLPIDLNCCLYKYQVDLMSFYNDLGNKAKAKAYFRASEARKKTINELMWNEEKGFFFDYNFKEKKQSSFYSIAGFYPLWAGLATKEQAQKMAKTLKKFEYGGGLTCTQKASLSKTFKQWDYPNGWANQHFIVIDGLKRYGFNQDAERIAQKWLNLNQKVFKETRMFFEKYNVVDCTIGKEGRYPGQTGFSWTNAVFVRLLAMFNQ